MKLNKNKTLKKVVTTWLAIMSIVSFLWNTSQVQAWWNISYWYISDSSIDRMPWCAVDTVKVEDATLLKAWWRSIKIAWCDLKDTSYDNWTPSNNQYYYTWDNAMQACPTWWHLPSLAEWRLTAEVLTRNKATSAYAWNTWWEANWLREAFHDLMTWTTWNTPINLPGYNSGTNQGTFGLYWSSTENNSSTARNLYLDSSNGVNWNSNSKTNGFSVRCFKDQ